MSKERQELIDILNRLELTQKDRLDLEYYINLGLKSNSDWNANFDEQGYIKNRTHFFKYCKTINFNKLDCGNDYANINFVLPKNEGDIHVYYYKENETIFEHILEVGVEIPLKHDITNNSINLYISALEDKGDSIEYYGTFIITDLENIKEEYNIPFYVKKYLSESYIPYTIARKSDIVVLDNKIPKTKIQTYNIENIRDISISVDNYYTHYIIFETSTYEASNIQQIIDFNFTNIVKNGYSNVILCNKLGSGEEVNCLVNINGDYKNITIKSGGCIKIIFINIGNNVVYSSIEGLVILNE